MYIPMTQESAMDEPLISANLETCTNHIGQLARRIKNSRQPKVAYGDLQWKINMHTHAY